LHPYRKRTSLTPDGASAVRRHRRRCLDHKVRPHDRRSACTSSRRFLQPARWAGCALRTTIGRHANQRITFCHLSARRSHSRDVIRSSEEGSCAGSLHALPVCTHRCADDASWAADVHQRPGFASGFGAGLCPARDTCIPCAAGHR
jgi:hypothetical protein